MQEFASDIDEERSAPNSNTHTRANTNSNSSEEPDELDPELSPQVQVYLENGGRFQSGALAGGRIRADEACRYITENVRDDPESLALWGEVVRRYCATGAPTSYHVMVGRYYARGQLPEEPGNAA